MRNAFLSLACLLILAMSAAAQDAEARVIRSPPFALSDVATAARIEGNLKLDVMVDKTGKVKSVRMWSLPAWPCDTNPKEEIREVLEAVKNNVLATNFSPAIKNGKAHDSLMRMTFVVGKTYRNIVRQTGGQNIATLEGAPPRFIQNGSLNGRATYLPKPEFSDATWRNAVYHSVTTQVLIDEKGNVISVGILFGDGALSTPVRVAACSAKFSPFLIRGHAVQVSGIIEYTFSNAPYVPKINTNP
ncbi:MAG: hypothetical protein ABI999_00495 [Acidobacteriota bacterium]